MDAHRDEHENGLLCSLHGFSVVEMSREQLIAFIGFLDTVSVGLGKRFADL